MYHGPPVTGQDSKAGVPSCPAFRTASTAPLPGGHGLKPGPGPLSLYPGPQSSPSSPSPREPGSPRDEAEEDADDVTQVRSAAVLALLQPQGGVSSWARSPAPAIPGPGPGALGLPSPPASLPPLPTSPSLKALSLYSRALSPTSGLSPDLSASPGRGLSRPSVSQPLCPALSSVLCLHLPALGLPDRLPSSSSSFTLHLTWLLRTLGAPSPWRQKGSCSFLGMGEGEGGVGCIPEFHHHWGRCPCVIFNQRV